MAARKTLMGVCSAPPTAGTCGKRFKPIQRVKTVTCGSRLSRNACNWLKAVYPDYDVQVTQQQFQQYFALLSIARSPNGVQEDDGSVSPVYNINAVLLNGTQIQATVGI
jgi:hypothetical protein